MAIYTTYSLPPSKVESQPSADISTADEESPRWVREAGMPHSRKSKTREGGRHIRDLYLEQQVQQILSLQETDANRESDAYEDASEKYKPPAPREREKVSSLNLLKSNEGVSGGIATPARGGRKGTEGRGAEGTTGLDASPGIIHTTISSSHASLASSYKRAESPSQTSSPARTSIRAARGEERAGGFKAPPVVKDKGEPGLLASFQELLSSTGGNAGSVLGTIKQKYGLTVERLGQAEARVRELEAKLEQGPGTEVEAARKEAMRATFEMEKCRLELEAKDKKIRMLEAQTKQQEQALSECKEQSDVLLSMRALEAELNEMRRIEQASEQARRREAEDNLRLKHKIDELEEQARATRMRSELLERQLRENISSAGGEALNLHNAMVSTHWQHTLAYHISSRVRLRAQREAFDVWACALEEGYSRRAGFIRLLARMRYRVERNGEVETRVKEKTQELTLERVRLMRQVVDTKTKMLACEKKYADLVAWVQSKSRTGADKKTERAQDCQEDDE